MTSQKELYATYEYSYELSMEFTDGTSRYIPFDEMDAIYKAITNVYDRRRALAAKRLVVTPLSTCVQVCHGGPAGEWVATFKDKAEAERFVADWHEREGLSNEAIGSFPE